MYVAMTEVIEEPSNRRTLRGSILVYLLFPRAAEKLILLHMFPSACNYHEVSSAFIVITFFGYLDYPLSLSPDSAHYPHGTT